MAQMYSEGTNISNTIKEKGKKAQSDINRQEPAKPALICKTKETNISR